MASRQIIQPNEGLDIKCHATAHQLTIGDSDSVSFAKLDFFPASIADFTNALVIGLHGGPSAYQAQTVYVNKGGNDITADGTILNPFLTINSALSSIVDASVTKKYNLLIGAGSYAENLVLKPNVNLTAESPLSVELSGVIGISSDWAVGGLNTACLSYLMIDSLSTFTIDYFGSSVTQALIALNGCTVYCSMLVNGNGTNTLFVAQQSSLVGALTCVSGFNQLYDCLEVNNLSLQTPVAAGLRPQQNFIFRVAGINSFSMLTPVGGDAMSTFLYESPSAALSLNGAAVFCIATVDSIPKRANLIILNSPILVRFNDANSLGYDPINPSEWTVQPVTTQEGLDFLSTRSQSGTYSSSASNLVGITAVQSFDMRYHQLGSIVLVSYTAKMTVSAIPSGICRLDVLLPTDKTASASVYDVTGTVQISCNDGFDNPSTADQTFGQIQAIVGSIDTMHMRFECGASATSSDIVVMGTFSYSL